MTNPTHRPEKKEKKIPRIPKVIGELAEKIVGKLYTPPPMSPKLLEQEKKRIMPLLEQFLDEQLKKKEEEIVDKAIKKVDELFEPEYAPSYFQGVSDAIDKIKELKTQK